MWTDLFGARSLRWLEPMPPGPMSAMESLSCPTAAGAAAGTATAAADALRKERRVGMGGLRGRGCEAASGLATESIQHVLRDAHNGGVVAAQAVAPVGAADGDHGAAVPVDAEHGVARTALLPLLVPLAVVRVPPG